MKLKLMTPENLAAEEDVFSVTLPTMMGEITVLPGHRHLAAVLSSGRLYFRKEPGGGVAGDMKLSGGFAEVTGSSVMVFAR